MVLDDRPDEASARPSPGVRAGSQDQRPCSPRSDSPSTSSARPRSRWGCFDGRARSPPAGRTRPDDAARDVAYGITGWTFLALGFAFQSLPYFGVAEGSDGANLAAALVTVALGAVAAVVLFGVTFLLVLPGEIRYSAEEHDLHLHVRRQRRGFRFWHQEPAPPPQPPDQG